MNKLKQPKTEVNSRKLLGVEDLQGYLSVGKATALKIGKQSGALRKIGRRTLYDREVIDKYVDSLE